MAVLLIVDDEKLILSVLSKVLGVRGYEILVAENGQTALEMLKNKPIDIMLADVSMHPMDGLELLKQTKALHPKLPVVLMTAYGTVNTAMSSLTLGAFDYVSKPIRVDELVEVLEHALATSQSGTGANEGTTILAPVTYQLGGIVAESREMQRVCEDIQKAAVTSAPSLLCGELGTGKSLIARAIHDCSARKGGEFIVLNCAETPEPVIAEKLFGASGGVVNAKAPSGEETAAQADSKPRTVVLEEIVMMPPDLLEKLILHLAKTVDEKGAADQASTSGLILSADVTLEALSQMGGFAALLARISGVRIEVKPLRERDVDILPLMAHFMYQQIGDWKKLPALAQDAREALLKYAWPGNHTELGEFVRDLLPQVHDGKITRSMLPPDIAGSPAAGAPATHTVFRRIDHRGKLLKKFLQERLPKKASPPA